jgi:hypothetical protein
MYSVSNDKTETTVIRCFTAAYLLLLEKTIFISTFIRKM